MYFIKLKKKFKIVSLMIFNSYTMWRPDVYTSNVQKQKTSNEHCEEKRERKGE